MCVEYGSSIRLWWSALWSQTPIQQAVRSLILPNSTCYMHTQEIMRLGKQGTAVIHHCTLASHRNTLKYTHTHTPTDVAHMRNDKLTPWQRRSKTHAPLRGPEKCAGIKRCKLQANLCLLSCVAPSAGSVAFSSRSRRTEDSFSINPEIVLGCTLHRNHIQGGWRSALAISRKKYCHKAWKEINRAWPQFDLWLNGEVMVPH